MLRSIYQLRNVRYICGSDRLTVYRITVHIGTYMNSCYKQPKEINQSE